jgi:TonB-linked SusC/RagA family outer membrane protein
MRKLGTWVLVALLTLFVSLEAAAQRRITGRVLGPNDEPIGAASVNVQGTAIGAYTGDDGRFALNNVPPGAQVLVARRLGYRRATMPVPATRDSVDIRLQRDVLQLEAQVVTGTTTTVSSANAANAVAVVSAEQLNRAPSPTIENALQGKIAGAVISTNSGAPGGGSQVQLRGVTSINASASPLYVVDGVIVSNDEIGGGMNSITNATTSSTLPITANQDQPANRISDLNPADIESIEVLKGASAGAIYGSKASNGVIIITTKRGTAGRSNFSVTQRLGQYTLSRTLGLRCFASATEAQSWWNNTIGASGALPVPFSPVCNDFEHQFYGGNPLSYESGLSVRGGTGGTSFYVGGLAKRDNAIQRETYYQKQSLTANLSQLLGERLTLRSNNQFIHTLTDRGISGNDNSPVVSPIDIFGSTPTFFDLQARLPNGQFVPNPFVGSNANPFQNATLVKNPQDVYRYIGSINTTLSAYTSQRQTLDFTFIGGVDAFQFNSRVLSPPDVYFEPKDGLPGTIVVGKSNGVYANLNLSGAHKFVLERATATTSFGMRQEHRQLEEIYNRGQNVPAGAVNVGLAAVQSLKDTLTTTRDLAFYVQEEVLTLGERLLVTGAVNTERSSVNGDEKKFYAYPKMAASYRIPFLPRYTDDIKVRLAYGKAGNQPPYGYKFVDLISVPYDGVLGARPALIFGDPGIKPETSTELEGGVDVQFLGGRMSLSATAYRKEVTDLILAAPVALSSGFTTRYLNGGSLRNTGTEFELSVSPIQRDDASWVSRTTYARNAGQVTSLDPSVPCGNVGNFFAVFFGAPYLCGGFSPTSVQAPIARGVNGVFESAPDFTMGFSNDFTYGPIRVGTLFDWRKGGKVVNLTNAFFDATLLRADTSASIARNALAGTAPIYLESGSFLKWRELSISYSLPKVMTNRIFRAGTNDVRLELAGRNLRTWTSYSGYDPEVSNFSNQNIGRSQDVAPYPPSRSIFFSVLATF